MGKYGILCDLSKIDKKKMIPKQKQDDVGRVCEARISEQATTLCNSKRSALSRCETIALCMNAHVSFFMNYSSTYFMIL